MPMPAPLVAEQLLTATPAVAGADNDRIRGRLGQCLQQRVTIDPAPMAILIGSRDLAMEQPMNRSDTGSNGGRIGRLNTDARLIGRPVDADRTEGWSMNIRSSDDNVSADTGDRRRG
jgi:hypothetical protein